MSTKSRPCRKSIEPVSRTISERASSRSPGRAAEQKSVCMEIVGTARESRCSQHTMKKEKSAKVTSRPPWAVPDLLQWWGSTRIAQRIGRRADGSHCRVRCIDVADVGENGGPQTVKFCLAIVAGRCCSNMGVKRIRPGNDAQDHVEIFHTSCQWPQRRQ